MPTERLSMRRIREVLRLRHQGLTERVIARTLGVSNGVVHGYVRRARLAGLTWPLPEDLDDEGLELLLFPAPAAASQSDRRPSPDWVHVEKELRRRSVTRLLLWEEYRAANPDGFGYTWFCTTFEAWMRVSVNPGHRFQQFADRDFINYGTGIPLNRGQSRRLAFGGAVQAMFFLKLEFESVNRRSNLTPVSASNFDPFERRALAVALALVGAGRGCGDECERGLA